MADMNKRGGNEPVEASYPQNVASNRAINDRSGGPPVQINNNLTQMYPCTRGQPHISELQIIQYFKQTLFILAALIKMCFQSTQVISD